VGVALLCFAGFGGPQRQVLQLSHAFFVVYNLTAGRVKLKLLKMKKLVFTAFAVGLGLTANVFLPGQVMAQVPSYVPSNGLVGWWPFNGNANDESGNGNNGTVNGATLTTDRFGMANKAYSFDGVNDWIEAFLNNNTVNNSFTISTWINANTWINNNPSAAESGFGIIGSRTAPGNATGLYILSSKLVWAIDRQNQNGIYNLTSINNSILQVPLWHHVVMTFDGSVVRIYTNSENNYFYNTGNLTLEFNSNLEIARDYANDFTQPTDDRYFNGKIDDIGVWNRALTDQEISDLFNGNICYEYVTVTDTLVINTGITGYNPITYLNTLKIWPNPSNDHITIDAGNLATMNGYSIKIEDAQGQQVFQNAVNQQQFYVDITTWGGSGLYFVRIIDPQGNTVDIKKIVLQ
jgi:hypothetical protein